MPGPFNAPPSFVDGNGRSVVFVRISQADYSLTLTPEDATPTALVESRIQFTTFEDGYPVIDLYTTAQQTITSVELDGNAGITTDEVPAPAGQTNLRIIAPPQPVPAGDHLVVIKHVLAEGVEWIGQAVKCSFDVYDREEPAFPVRQRAPFLERYLPCNLEYDQHPVSLRVKVIAGTDHAIYSNSETRIDLVGGNQWLLTYPATFTSSSILFVLIPHTAVEEHTFSAGSVDVTIISTTPDLHPQAFELPTRDALKALLDAGFGTFPFPRLLLHATLDQGMEYVGAATVSAGSLKHELVHQYAGRCLLPADGDAGWVDEGVASWFEFGGLSHRYPPGDKTNIGNRSPYYRVTDRRAWTQGKVMMSYLHYRLRARGGVPALVRHLIYDRRLAFTPLTARQYQAAIEAFAGQSFTQEFERAIYTQPAL